MYGEYNILIGDGVKERDKDGIFGPLQLGDEFITMPDDTRWPQILKRCGVFPSTSQARKCGWDKDVSFGYSEVVVGKKRNQICVWKVIGDSTMDSNPLPRDQYPG